MSQARDPSRTGDRRSRPRSASDHAATGLAQMVIRDPASAAAAISSDLHDGAEPAVVLGVLDAVEAILKLRGLDREAQLKALRRSVERRSIS